MGAETSKPGDLPHYDWQEVTDPAMVRNIFFDTATV